MLRTLQIKNFVLIDSIEIDFAKGLNILTGETGAGKSILLDALGLILGNRSNISFIRKNKDQAVITAVFEHINSDIKILLNEHNIVLEDSLIIKRILFKDGKSKSYLNDHIVSVGLLKQIAINLIEIHGQFDNLLNKSMHKNILDSYANNKELLEKVSQSYSKYADSRNKFYEMKRLMQNQLSQKEFLQFAVKEFDALDPKENEENELIAQRELSKNHAKITSNLATIDHLLNGDGGNLANTSTCINLLEKTTVLLSCGTMQQTLSNISECLNKSSSELIEAGAILTEVVSNNISTAHDLDVIENRLYDLRALARKHGCVVNELCHMHNKLIEDLTFLVNSDDNLQELEKKVDIDRENYLVYANKLHDIRCKKSILLSKLVEQELKSLKLEKAKFKVDIAKYQEQNWNEAGINNICFTAQTNPGNDFDNIINIASGGELSRFMLALKSVLSTSNKKTILIFDEIDSGVSGSVSSAIGEKMSKIASDSQVLSITHSPQVASYSDLHLLVTKQVNESLTTTKINRLNGTNKVNEIARMLSGNNISREAVAAAQKLMSHKVDC